MAWYWWTLIILLAVPLVAVVFALTDVILDALDDEDWDTF